MMTLTRIERVFRERQLTAAEVARDEVIRRKVQVEFPAALPSGIASGRLSKALREALRASAKSMCQIAQAAGVSQIAISRFLSAERDI